MRCDEVACGCCWVGCLLQDVRVDMAHSHHTHRHAYHTQYGAAHTSMVEKRIIHIGEMLVVISKRINVIVLGGGLAVVIVVIVGNRSCNSRLLSYTCVWVCCG